MHKVLAVAVREYRAAVQTRAFIVSLILMPLIGLISVGVQLLVTKAENQTTLACVWAAGRLFRVGLLMQGKSVKLADLAKWVVSG